MHLSIAGTGTTVVVSLRHTDLYIWQLQPGRNLLAPMAKDSKGEVPGTWTRVPAQGGWTGVPAEAAADARFFVDQAAVSNYL